LGGGFSIGELEVKAVPNQGIKRSLRAAACTALGFGTVGILGGVIGGTFWGKIAGTEFSNNFGGVFGGIVFGVLGVLAGLWFGGYICIQHYTLRLLLYYSRVIPWDIESFLNYCVDRIFMNKVGGGYIFIHRLLMEHFASLRENLDS
jgi:hypothetical protein